MLDTAENPRVRIGDNNPPADEAPNSSPFEALKIHADDLLVEAANWADGKKVETQEQADECLRLIDELQQADTDLDAQRVLEKRPLDEAVEEIQGRYNLYIAPAKNKKPGKITNAIAALRKTREPFLLEQERLRKVAADEAAAEAAEKAKAAAAAMATAQASSDLSLHDAAEDLVRSASAATSFAARAAKPVASGLRSSWVPALTDPKAALLHYVATQPDRVREFLLVLAKEDVRAGKRQIPGIAVTEERHAA